MLLVGKTIGMFVGDGCEDLELVRTVHGRGKIVGLRGHWGAWHQRRPGERRLHLRWLCVAVVVLAACHRTAAPEPASPSYRVHDLTPVFWRFWDQAAELPQADQVRLFQDQVVPAHLHVY